MNGIRRCSRANCNNPAVATMTYGYQEATAVIGPLAPTPQPGAYDLCEEHALTITVPVGWQLVRLVTEFEDVTPSDDDLLALADAIREASKKDVPPPAPARRDVRRRTDISALQPRPRPRLHVIDGDGEDPEDGGAAPQIRPVVED